EARADAQQATTTLEVVGRVLDAVLPRNMLRALVDMEMLPLIVVALLFGAALTLLDDRRRSAMTNWLETVREAMARIVGFAMKLAPYAVFCLIFSVAAKFGLDLLQKLAFYVALTFCGYLVQMLVLYPAILAGLCRRSPIAFFRGAIPAVVTAFSTSSS